MPFFDDDDKPDLLCTYAALILQDENLPLSADNIAKLVKAAGAQDDIEAFYPKVFGTLLRC